MSGEWYLTDEDGRRGPYSLAELRRMRAAFELPPQAVVCDEAGTTTSIEALLPEFKTGPLLRPPYQRPTRTRQPIFPWLIRRVRDAIPVFRVRFSLRSLLIFVLILCPPLGFIANDLAETARQERIVRPWVAAGGQVEWRHYAWRWRRDVSGLRTNVALDGPVCTSLDQLPYLQSIHLQRGIPSAQFAEILRATQIERLHLPDDCKDEDLTGIERLKIKELTLRHRELPRTMRRLRRHPELEFIRLWCHDYEYLQCLNDCVTIPRAWDVHSPGNLILEPFKSELAAVSYIGKDRLYASQERPSDRERYNVALIGAAGRQDLLRRFVAAEELSKNVESSFALTKRSDAEYFLVAPVSAHVAVLGRVLWRADFAVVVVSARDGVTATVHEHCLIARAGGIPRCLFVLSDVADVPSERIAEVQVACSQEAAGLELEHSLILDGDTEDLWREIARFVKLRPPGGDGNTMAKRREIRISKPLPLRTGKYEIDSNFSVLRRGILESELPRPHVILEGQALYYYGPAADPGERVVVLHGDRILDLGCIEDE